MAGNSQYFSDDTTISGHASGAILAKTFVKNVSTSPEAFLFAACGASDTPCGIAIAKAADGEAVTVATDGMGYLLCDGSSVNIAAGDKLNSIATDGTGGKAGTAEPFGAEAFEPCTVASQEILVQIYKGYTKA